MSTSGKTTHQDISSAIESRSIDWVPEDERTGKVWHQGPLWFLGNFQYFSIPIGFIGPAMGLSLGWTVVAAAAGIAIGTLFMAFHASQGPTMGLPQMIQSRAQFGYRGVIVPLLGTLFTYLAFNVADTVLMSEGLHSSFGLDPLTVAVVTAVGAALLAVFGHDWLHTTFRVLLYVALPITAAVSLGVVFGAAGGTAPAPDAYGFSWIGFATQLAAAAAYNITYAPYVSDYSRYLPVDTSPKKVIASVFFGASTSAIWLIALGAWLAIHLGAADGLAGLQLAGNTVLPHLGDAAALLSALALWATMGMNAYGGTLTVLTMVDSFTPIRPGRRARIVTVAVLALVWLVVAEQAGGDTVGTVLSSLTLMLYVLVPWTATNLADFFLVRRGHYALGELFRPDGVYGRWSWRGLTACGVGFAAQVPFMVIPELAGWSYTGFVAQALGGADIAWLVGLVVTSAVYLVLARSLDLGPERRILEASPRPVPQEAT